MPLDANPSNSKNGVAVTATPFDETDHNKVDNSDSSLDNDDSSNEPKEDTTFDPKNILESIEINETFKPTKTSSKSNEKPVDKKDGEDVDDIKDEEVSDKDAPEVSDDREDKDTEKEEKEESDKEEKEVNKDKEVADTTKNPKERDYSDFTDEEKRLLKKCDNRAFSVLSAKIKEHKTNYEKAEAARQELHKIVNEKAIPLEFYQHPDAYTLTDDYKKLAGDFTSVQREREHFKAQLLKIKKGEQWIDIKGYKGNTPVYSEPIEPTEEAALDLQERISEAAAIQGQIQGQVGALATHFKTRHEADTKSIVSAVEGYVAKLHEGYKPEQKHIDAAMEMLPKSKRSDPLAQSVAKMYGVIAKLAMALQNKTAVETAKAAKANDDKEAGVRTTGLAKGGANGNRTNGNKGHINFKGRSIPAEYDPNDFKYKEDE